MFFLMDRKDYRKNMTGAVSYFRALSKNRICRNLIFVNTDFLYSVSTTELHLKN